MIPIIIMMSVLGSVGAVVNVVAFVPLGFGATKLGMDGMVAIAIIFVLLYWIGTTPNTQLLTF